MNKIGLRKKLFILHAAVILMTILGMSVNSYDSQVKTTKEIITQFHTDISRRFVTPVSLAISGNNYANISLPSFVRELIDIESLIYFEVNGYSDSMNKYAITYHKDDKKIRRSQYDPDYEKNITNKLDNLKRLSLSEEHDKKKILFLIQRVQDELLQYRQNIDSLSNIRKNLKEMLLQSKHPINTKHWTLRVNLPATNKNGGEIVFIYDVSRLKSIKENLVLKSVYEVFLAALFSIPFIWLSGRILVRPIESLTEYISNDLKDMKPDGIPVLNSNDEIGYLANKFKDLLIRINQYISKIEELGNTDALTELYNRRYYNEISDLLIAEAIRAKEIISFLYIDIDNFKKYNDNYGHASGDIVLKKVASCIKNSLLRSTDYCFRLGGEEFLVIIQTNNVDDSLKIAEKIRSNIEIQNIAHKFNDNYGKITISLGLCSVSCGKDSELKVMKDVILSAADKELYKAKNSGRNRIFKTIFH